MISNGRPQRSMLAALILYVSIPCPPQFTSCLTFKLRFKTVVSIKVFFLAMALNPEAMKKAQEEIDSVTGNERLPCFEDRPNLPYVNAVQLEVLRWHTIAPNGRFNLLIFVFDGRLIT
jgi:hypothetical protein